jgi:pyruvate, water dikinase
MQSKQVSNVASGSVRQRRYIKWFKEIGIEDVPLVGGKNASLGEMYHELAIQGVKVPNGFAITAEAYRHFLRETGLNNKIEAILHDLDTNDVENLRRTGAQIRHAILAVESPRDLEDQIVEAYDQLFGGTGCPLNVAVRSSATAEDLPDASFAGQQETYLNVLGPAALLHTCRLCFASLFTDRAISYRTDKGFDHCKVIDSAIRVPQSDLALKGP